jgi:hypothetical protein
MIALAFLLVFGVFKDFTRIMAALLLFRFDFRQFWLPVLITSCILSLSTELFVHILKLPFALSEIIDAMILTNSLFFFMRLPFWYSVILSLSAWLYGFLMECVGYVVLINYGIFEPKEFLDNYIPTCTLEFIGGVLCVLVSSFLYKRGWGFVFMQEKVRVQEKINLMILVGLIISVFLMEFTLYLIFHDNNTALTLISLSSFLFSLCLLTIYIKVKREWRQYYSNRNGKDYDL